MGEPGVGERDRDGVEGAGGHTGAGRVLLTGGRRDRPLPLPTIGMEFLLFVRQNLGFLRESIPFLGGEVFPGLAQ